MILRKKMYSKHTATLMASVHEIQQQVFTNIVKKIILERFGTENC